MRRVMSVDIKKQPREPRTPRKLRINPPSPEATRNTPRPQANGEGSGASTGSPESTRKSGFVVPNKDLASAKEASRRMNVLADAISPRKLPEDRFNSIVKRLNYASITNGINGTSSANGTPSREEQSVAGASDVSRPAPRKQPRKLSINHTAERMNGVVADGG
jgi:hypothetical protein